MLVFLLSSTDYYKGLFLFCFGVASRLSLFLVRLWFLLCFLGMSIVFVGMFLGILLQCSFDLVVLVGFLGWVLR